MADTLLHAKGIVKDFPGTRALDRVELIVRKGEIHGLLGENGAGKSTLVKILNGNYRPDEGELLFESAPVTIDSPHQAQRLGIGMVHQELSLVSELSVAENIFVGRLPTNKLGLVERKVLRQQAAEILDRLRLPLDPNTLVGNISLAYRQMVEIAKAVSLNCKLLILDEPTSSLTEHESQTLFELVRGLKAQGVSILYISHKLSEVFMLTSQITVLRDGALVGSYPTSELDEGEAERLMVGRALSNLYPPHGTADKDVVLQVSNLETTKVGPCSFSLYQGEILGISGLVGAGRTELASAIFGADRWQQGSVALHGSNLTIRSPYDAVRAGIGYLPEDRKTAGLYLDFSIQRNMVAAKLDQVTRAGFVDGALERSLAVGQMQRLNVRSTGPEQLVRTLSGGNQQKVLLGKWLAVNPKVLIVDEPTRGIDVGAKSEIHSLLRELATSGIGIIMISSELPEIIGMSDRILVMYGGQIVAEVARQDASEELLLSYASGRGALLASRAAKGAS